MNQQHVKNLDMICAELEKACQKHPYFCDIITKKSERYLARLESWRKNHTACLHKGIPLYSAELILDEEILEALHAYKEGDKAHALQEFAQCGAVILRIMEKIEKEIDG